MPSNQSINIPTQEKKRLRWLILFSGILFSIGIFTPLITISKFIVIKNTFSVFSGVVELLMNGQIILFILIAGFSIVLPVMKFWVLWQLSSKNLAPTVNLHKLLHLMHEYGRWAMLDVMVVAILIVTVKLGAIASIEVHFGLYVFGAAVLIIMLITHRIKSLTTDSNKLNIG